MTVHGKDDGLVEFFFQEWRIAIYYAPRCERVSLGNGESEDLHHGVCTYSVVLAL